MNYDELLNQISNAESFVELEHSFEEVQMRKIILPTQKQNRLAQKYSKKIELMTTII